MSQPDLPPLAISMGEPAGIGPDLILQLFAKRDALGLPPFIVFGNAAFLAARAARLGLDIALTATGPGSAASTFAGALPVADIGGEVPDQPGQLDAGSATVVVEAITRAVRASLDGACRGVITAPIHKSALYAAGFAHPGHTEYLAALCAEPGETLLPVMMLATEDLRVIPATIHVPVSQVPALLTPDLLLATGRIVARDLGSRFGIAAPRLAMAGLNPHAGEGGAIGTEDRDVITPVVAQLAREGIDISGPLPADTLFYLPHWRQYDAVIAMYHDQALIPIKTVAFEEAVNVTLGLPVVRTSPDHGTAFDLAGTGRGSTTSLLAAIRMADRMTGGTRVGKTAER